MRFPSTTIRLVFYSLIDEMAPPPVLQNTLIQTQTRPVATPSRSYASPLSINIPPQVIKQESTFLSKENRFISPFPSPTGTLRLVLKIKSLFICNSLYVLKYL